MPAPPFHTTAQPETDVLALAALESAENSDMPLLIGNLRVQRATATHSRMPILLIDIYCCSCRCFHAIRWPDKATELDAVELIRMTCSTGVFRGMEVAVGIDPTRERENAETLGAFQSATRNYRLASVERARAARKIKREKFTIA